jgi:hypothetical protein
LRLQLLHLQLLHLRLLRHRLLHHLFQFLSQFLFLLIVVLVVMAVLFALSVVAVTALPTKLVMDVVILAETQVHVAVQAVVHLLVVVRALHVNLVTVVKYIKVN